MSDAPKKSQRGRTLAVKDLARESKRGGIETEDNSYPTDIQRPKTRGDCVDGIRPCPYVSCSQHLYLDVNPETGAIKLNFPHLEVWEMEESCALDVADRGGITLEEVGEITNLTRERIRQVEVRGLAKIKAQSLPAFGCPDCHTELEAQIDTVEENGMSKEVVIYFCRDCDRYYRS